MIIVYLLLCVLHTFIYYFVEVIVGSPKSKTWKGMVAKQLRRIQTGSPVSPTAPPTYPEGATIGVPLCLCPPVSI